MKRVESATSYRWRRQRVSIHQGASMCDVVSKSTRRNQVGYQSMKCKAVGGAGKVTCGIVCLQVNDDCSCCASNISQCGFLYNCRGSSCVRADTQQARC